MEGQSYRCSIRYIELPVKGYTVYREFIDEREVFRMSIFDDPNFTRNMDNLMILKWMKEDEERERKRKQSLKEWMEKEEPFPSPDESQDTDSADEW